MLPPLGPSSRLPSACADLLHWRILLVATAFNSFTQRVWTYLRWLGFEQVSLELAISEGRMVEAARKWDPHVIVCPFLTMRVPEEVFKTYMTLVVHPGPPGDAGPSALDWVLMGDDGSIAEPTAALDELLRLPSTPDSPTRPPHQQRSHWAAVVFQANEHLDGGAVWAWEQYKLPAALTKAQLYQGPHSQAAIHSLYCALVRIYTAVSELLDAQIDDPRVVIRAEPKEEWSTLSITLRERFLGGPTHERPLLLSKSRRPDWRVHHANDILRIINASDSQPGAQLNPLTPHSKTALFAYGAHVHLDRHTVPLRLLRAQGHSHWTDVPPGAIVAVRNGAVFVKTKPCPHEECLECGVGVWITHGRLPKSGSKPLPPKVPMVDAILAAGHGEALQGLQEWKQDTWSESFGTWQQVYVKSVRVNGAIAQLVYWDFYNGAFSTSDCQLLLEALKWTTHPDRGDVKVLALMGGPYFSNGIALNIIEAAADPGMETWRNINAIDDIVEFVMGDTHPERSPFMDEQKISPLCERGIVTVACLRGNSAAGGVALAAACDVVIAGRGVVVNPAYRTMGLHGSEFHSYSYLKRCGPHNAAHMLLDMLPLDTTTAQSQGLVDIQVGAFDSTPGDIEKLCLSEITSILMSDSTVLDGAPRSATDSKSGSSICCAPWSSNLSSQMDLLPRPVCKSLTDLMCENKRREWAQRELPLLHYRNEELSQMLLDSFHPVRSERYHSRRYAFIHKVKATRTPSRLAVHIGPDRVGDGEELQSFDDVPGWVRGEEWAYVEMEPPKSLATSEKTRIDLGPALGPVFTPLNQLRKLSAGSDSTLETSSLVTPDMKGGVDSGERDAKQIDGRRDGTKFASPGSPATRSLKQKLSTAFKGMSLPHSPRASKRATLESTPRDDEGAELPLSSSEIEPLTRGSDVQFPCLYDGDCGAGRVG